MQPLSHFSAGSIPEKSGDKYYNTSMSFGPDGALLGTFRKVRSLITCDLHTMYMSLLFVDTSF